jgi:hypothetical protein
MYVSNNPSLLAELLPDGVIVPTNTHYSNCTILLLFLFDPLLPVFSFLLQREGGGSSDQHLERERGEQACGGKSDGEQ